MAICIDETYCYDPLDPLNVADRANDPDDGIDYDAIIAETESTFRAGLGYRFTSIEAFDQWLGVIFDQAIARHANSAA